MVTAQVSRRAQRLTQSRRYCPQTQMRISLLQLSPYKGIAAVHTSRLLVQMALQTRGKCQVVRMQHQMNCILAWRMRPGATLSQCMHRPIQ